MSFVLHTGQIALSTIHELIWLKWKAFVQEGQKTRSISIFKRQMLHIFNSASGAFIIHCLESSFSLSLLPQVGQKLISFLGITVLQWSQIRGSSNSVDLHFRQNLALWGTRVPHFLQAFSTCPYPHYSIYFNWWLKKPNLTAAFSTSTRSTSSASSCRGLGHVEFHTRRVHEDVTTWC